MKVAIDISPLQTGHKVRGVGFYLKYLKAALESRKDTLDFQYFSSLSEVTSADVLHYPYFDPFSSVNAFSSSIPTVATIHDLTPIKFAQHFPAGIKGKLYWQLNKRRVRKISGIITDSECSKEDIINYLAYPANKVHVIYLAADNAFTPKELSKDRKNEISTKYSLPEKFALYVGDVTWNKNLPRLLKACINAKIPLILVGKALIQKDFDKSHPWNADLVVCQKLLESSDLLQALGFVEDKDLIDIYRLATVFTMPSLYEGFGLPVVEAMQVGCPVVTSREGSIPEVGGDAVRYVNALDINDIAAGINEVFTSKSIQAELTAKGLKQAKKFSWSKTAEETIAVYKDIISHER